MPFLPESFTLLCMHDLFSGNRAALLFDPIMNILEEHPEGIREYDLLLKLEEQDLLPDGRDGDLELFRSHFFLFHVLYRLQARLREEERYNLSIFCLDIRLEPFSEAEVPEDLPAEHDPVAAYYLDLSNLEGVTEEDVRRMIGNFFSRLEAYYKSDEDLAVLGLPPDAAPEEIRRRYRTLAFEYHPDTGGNEEDFRTLRAAAERLKKAGIL